jgi:hypothetical protein
MAFIREDFSARSQLAGLKSCAADDHRSPFGDVNAFGEERLSAASRRECDYHAES